MPDNKPDPAAEQNGASEVDYLRGDGELSFRFHSFDVYPKR
jgi:hypothetical protein